ncbi:MAG: NADP-dependent malic enzyme [Alphaproteobacteria bacterium]|nr:NADP-dependent malic enzyme [Alphaproteobacteria bacterium]
MNDDGYSALDREALRMHAQGRPGKIEVVATKPLTTQYHLSLAYSPGVAAPCLEIEKDPALAYDYTAKGNLVAVISNGTAVLGLGDLGALASKPVMEGKAVLFKRFADVDGIDLEVSTRDVDEFINCVRYLGASWGGINLEDIKAPECFVIEERLKELLDIPVFHDDQHGTAIIAAAGLINALHLTGRDITTCKLVVNGAGASGIACVELFKLMGMPNQNVILCDTKGVLYEGRTEGMNQWKSAHLVATKARTLAEAMQGCDVVMGLSAKGAITQAMVKSMAAKPIIFALANPDPEISPEDAKAVRSDAIIATGRSDYPNQINNVLGFPYIFRGALDVRATTINDAMKLAAAEALAALAREDVPDEVAAAYSGRRLRYGPDYLIPAPFDPRLIVTIPAAVAEAAMRTGVARRPIADMGQYRVELRARLDPAAGILAQMLATVSAVPRRIVFAEGEEERVIRAALAFQDQGYGIPVLIGREERVKEVVQRLGLHGADSLEVHNARLSKDNARYTEFLYKRMQRKGYLQRDCLRLVNQDRNVFGACMVAMGDADAMVTGVTRPFASAFEDIANVIDTKPGARVFGLTMVIARGRTVFMADTAVHEVPTPEAMVDIVIQSAAFARRLGHEPRIAMLSYANFGTSWGGAAKRVREAVRLLDERRVDFEYDGEMQADVALDHELMKSVFPFCRLSGAANVLIMPALNAANIAAKLMAQLGGGTVVGPILTGLTKPMQIMPMGSNVSDIVNIAALAAHEVGR